MAFISTIQLKTSSNNNKINRARSTSNIPLIISTDLAGINKAGHKRYSLRLGISGQLAKEARLIAGDTVDVLFDRESNPVRGLIKRVKNDGWALVKGDKNGSKLFLKISNVEGMPTFALTYPCNAVVTDDGILFDLPHEHSFTENLREKHDRNRTQGT